MSLFRILRKFRLILSRHQKFRVIELGILMVFGGLLEMCSVSLVLPFAEAVMNPQTVMENTYVRWLCGFLGIDTPQSFLMLTALVLAAVYILKNLYLVFEYSIQYRFVYGNMLAMQKRFLAYLLHRPYEYFLKINSGEIIRIVNRDIPYVFELLLAILGCFSEMVVSMMLVATAFVIAPLIMTVMAAVLLVLLLAINQVIKPALRRAGEEYQRSAADMNKWLLQSIQGIKETKVMMKEEFFRENYNECGKQYVKALRTNQTLSLIPRFLIEAVCMSTMFLLLAVLLYGGTVLEEIVPVVMAVAMAAVRLMPAANRISLAFTYISYRESMMDKLIENQKDISGREEVSLMMDRKDQGSVQGKAAPLTYEKSLDFHEITYRYPGSEQKVLHDASMTIAAGESVGIVGESGAGKTTAVDIILGLLRPEKGKILVDGHDAMDDLGRWLAQVGYIPQMIFMLDDTIRANIAFGTPESEFRDEDVWHALEEASLAEFVRQLADGLDTEIGERGIRLSGGQRQRIGIARALFRNPKVLIFDEATSALDSNTESAIMESIHRLHGKKTMIIIAHRLTTIEACDHIFRVEGGTIRRER